MTLRSSRFFVAAVIALALGAPGCAEKPGKKKDDKADKDKKNKNKADKDKKNEDKKDEKNKAEGDKKDPKGK